jgi:hypothetical protein
MAQQLIGIGAAPNDGTGDQLRTAFDKVNDNFTEVYVELGGTSLSNISFSGNTISTDDTNGSLTLDPNGTGAIILDNAVTANNTVAISGALTVASAAAFSGPSNTAVTFTAADTTPTVAAGNLFLTDTGALTISDFDDGKPGQIINIVSKGAVTYDVTTTDLKGGTTDIVTAAGDVTTWVSENGTTWHLINFMDASANLSTGH